jgi:hypothetical protein
MNQERHIHHIQPKYLIGIDNSPDNLTPPISVELHAALHKDLLNILVIQKISLHGKVYWENLKKELY